MHTSDVTFGFTAENSMIIHNKRIEPWKVTIVDTGLNTMTGGRIKRIKDYIGDETFMLTYGDAVGDVDVFVEKWGEGLKWINKHDGGPHEANFLKLDCSKLKTTFGWSPRWDLTVAIEKTVEWAKVWASGGDVSECMDRQIAEFFNF